MVEPVSLELAKQHLRAGDDEDLVINRCIKDARGWVEAYTGQILTPRRLSVAIDHFTDQIPVWPVAAVFAVTYVDAAGATITLPTSVYGHAAIRRPARLTLKSGQRWPSLYAGSGQITVDLDAGYDDPEDIPPGLIRAMLMLIGGYYADRETGGLSENVEKSAQLACGASSRGWAI